MPWARRTLLNGDRYWGNPNRGRKECRLGRSRTGGGKKLEQEGGKDGRPRGKAANQGTGTASLELSDRLRILPIPTTTNDNWPSDLSHEQPRPPRNIPSRTIPSRSLDHIHPGPLYSRLEHRTGSATHVLTRRSRDQNRAKYRRPPTTECHLNSPPDHAVNASSEVKKGV